MTDHCDLCDRPIDGQPTLTGDSHPAGPNHVVCQHCADVDPLPVDDDGIYVPMWLRNFTRQVVFKTPTSTVQHFGTRPLDSIYVMVEASDFWPDEDDDVRHPELAPDMVSISPEGEPEYRFQVTRRGHDNE